jgi:DNA-binding NtrC family response regulator
MHRVVLIDSDELNRRMMATHLRETGSDVIEATDEQALALFREGVEAVVVWNARDAEAATALLSELDSERRSSVWLFATSQKLDRECPKALPVSTVRKLLGAARSEESPVRPELVEDSPDAGIPFELPKDGVDFFELERQVLAQALTRSRGNQTRAASLLGLTRDQVRYRMSKFGMMRRVDEPVTEDQPSG